jgi:N-acetylglucosamine kinase-like BadF-type ATPase
LELDGPTSLTLRVLDFFQLDSAEAVLHLMTSRITTHPSEREIGHLARLLLDEASRGDATALQLVESHGALLGDYALTAARLVGIGAEPFTLILSGGVLRHESRVLSDTLVAQVRRASPGVQPVFSRFEPAIGALLLALDETLQSMLGERLVRLESTLPPVDVFRT